MRISVVNKSRKVPKDALLKIVDALNIFAAIVSDAWGLGIGIVTLDDTPPDGAWPLFVYDKASTPGAEGDHDIQLDGTPYGEVFFDTIPGGELLRDASGQGGSLAGVMSHELAEMLGDRYANVYADGPFIDRSTGKSYAQVAFELCDPVQETGMPLTLGDGTIIDGSNFIYPAWFSARSAVGKYDAVGVLTAPLTLAAGGYVIVQDKGTEDEVFGRRKICHAARPAAWREERVRSRSARRRASAFELAA